MTWLWLFGLLLAVTIWRGIMYEQTSYVALCNLRRIPKWKNRREKNHQKAMDEFICQSLKNAIRLDFSHPEPKLVCAELVRRRMCTDIFAELTIGGKTDTIDGFFEKAKRRDSGSPVPLGGNFDYFICPFTGDKLPVSESVNFYQGLWIIYLNKDPGLVAFMKEYGVENLGNSYRCKKALSLYDADKEGFSETVRRSIWYQNIIQHQIKRSLEEQIQTASMQKPKHSELSNSVTLDIRK